MFTGASTADLAIVLVDARNGVVLQTRRHAQISALLGVRHVVAVREQDGPRRLGRASASPRSTAEVARARRPARDRRRRRRSRSARCTATTSSSAPSARPGTTARRCSSTSRPSTSPPTATRDHLRLPIQWVARPTDGGAAALPRPARRRDAARRATRSWCCPRGIDDDGHRDRHAGRRARRRRAAAVGRRSSWPTRSTSAAATMLVSPGDEPPRRARAATRDVCWMADEPLRAGPPLRAQAHDAHRPRDGPGDPRAHRSRHARGRGRARARWASTTSAA